MNRSMGHGNDLRNVDARPNGREDADRQKLSAYDLVCFSHLRWDFVFQRPHHLLGRNAAFQRVFYVEEPVEGTGEPWLELRRREGGVVKVVPHLPPGLDAGAAEDAQRRLVDDFLKAHGVTDFIAWYYTPMAWPFTRHLSPAVVVYDCMDELSNFKGAPPELRRRERELFARADVAFTGGHSLYEAKRHEHDDIHPFPSSIDAAHFEAAQGATVDPDDQAGIPRPRLGYFGVIDERMDLDLLDGIARRRPDWHLVLIGPTAKIDPADLPRRPNIHALGPKPYAQLPAYLGGWDVALLPFACNEATRFISPTKTPEYLAAGRPVVSSPIRDVVVPYGQRGLVRIADSADAFVRAIEEVLAEDPARPAWREAVRTFLAGTSWDRTWARMMHHVAAALPARAPSRYAPRGTRWTGTRAGDRGTDG